MRNDIQGNMPPCLDIDSPPAAGELTRLYNLVNDGTWKRTTITSDTQGHDQTGTFNNPPNPGDVQHLDEKSQGNAWVTVNEVDYP